MGEQMVAVITDTPQGKDYRAVEPTDIAAFEEANQRSKSVERPGELILPEITGNDIDDVSNSTGIRVHLYGMKTWGSLFNPRQLLIIQTLIENLHSAIDEMKQQKIEVDYRKALELYSAFLISRIVQRGGRVNIWNTQRETLEHPFSLAKISMTWDYPEANLFSDSTGGASSGLDWICRVILHESNSSDSSVLPGNVYLGDGSNLSKIAKKVDIVVTDPPYFDEISYADLSDYFYVWLKRGLSFEFPEVFATPLTPKTDEATALKHRHGSNAETAKMHFVSKLAKCFTEAKDMCKPNGVLAIMFAHQSTEAWTSLVNAIFEAGLNVVSTYPIETERANRPRGIDSSALASSITVVCRPREIGSAVSFREVRREVEQTVAESVHRFWGYGFRGADLIVACYGPAVGVFGRHSRVERADGTPVTVPELLDLARESALKAIAGEFTGDPLSRLYFIWANLYGISEQSWDDVRLVVQIGGESENAMEVARGRGLFVVDGSSCRLALLHDRVSRKHLGDESDTPLIDQLHHAMQLWKEEKRGDLVNYLRENELLDHVPYWKLAQALFEVMPRDEEDWKLISSLLGERETLRQESKRGEQPKQRTLFDS